MSGIPVFTQSPINAAKAEGITPQTAAAPAGPGTQRSPTTNTATTTAVPSSTTSYPLAKPGAAAVPAPTGLAQRYAPVQPTPTTKTSSDDPPAPQPGAVPQLPSMTNKIPPPPKVGEKFQPPPSQNNSPQPYPAQMGIPPPTTAYGAQPPSSSTSTTTSYSSSLPVPLPSDNLSAQRRSFEHPPGYVQNPYASNLTTAQSRAQEAEDTGRDDTYDPNHINSTAAFGVDPESVWNTAKGWASTAGKKLSEVESEVWRRVNGEK